MIRLATLVFMAFLAVPLAAQGAEELRADMLIEPAGTSDLSEFRWRKRPVVVFADDVMDPAFTEQIELLRDGARDLLARDVVVLVDTDPAARSPLRLRMRPRGFMLVLVGKDGDLKIRKPFPWDVREISRSIDKMPMRQREIRDAKEAEGRIND